MGWLRGTMTLVEGEGRSEAARLVEVVADSANLTERIHPDRHRRA
jgi:hypothetical protein